MRFGKLLSDLGTLMEFKGSLRSLKVEENLLELQVG